MGTELFLIIHPCSSFSLPQHRHFLPNWLHGEDGQHQFLCACEVLNSLAEFRSSGFFIVILSINARIGTNSEIYTWAGGLI